jgi:putative FmdB family regulatory protein
MPTYEYQAKDPAGGCDTCRARFEVQQSMRDEPLTACPQCGAPITRLISACGINTRGSERSMLSDRNLRAKGLTKLVNEGGGKFRKVT